MTTKIEWTDETWNPVTGCAPVSEGCQNCYAERQIRSGRTPAVHGSKNFQQVTYHIGRLGIPARWKKPRRIFVCSMGDLFHKDVPLNVIQPIWGAMVANYHHTFMVLTKRPERMLELLRPAKVSKNIWLGVSVEDASTLYRVDCLREITAAKRFISFEPLLENPSPNKSLDFSGIHWVICGAESGPRRRPCKIEWIRSLRDQCVSAGVPFFLKQMEVNGKLVKMPELDGKVWDQFPNVEG